MKFKKLYILLNELNDPTIDTIAIFPGSFKPPHKGHWNIVKALKEVSDKVIILISDPRKEIRDEEGIIITPEISHKIFSLYIKADQLQNIEPMISTYNRDITNKKGDIIYHKGDTIPSPVNAMSEYIYTLSHNNPNLNFEIIIGNSDKDSDRYNDTKVSDYPNVKYTIKNIPATQENGVAISSTEFRKLLANRKNDPEFLNKLKNYLPDSILNNKQYLDEFLSIIDKI